MANDIITSISGNPIKNGTLVVGCPTTGFPPSPTTIVYNKYVSNSPNINDIQNKYDTRFDDPRYYYGSNN